MVLTSSQADNSELATLQGEADLLLPPTFSQPTHLSVDIACRAQNQGPRELGSSPRYGTSGIDRHPASRSITEVEEPVLTMSFNLARV